MGLPHQPVGSLAGLLPDLSLLSDLDQQPLLPARNCVFYISPGEHQDSTAWWEVTPQPHQRPYFRSSDQGALH